MVGVSRLLVALALAGLFTQQAYADVIPSRRAADTTDSSKKVESRLVELGVDAQTARSQVQNLTDSQTNYFADSAQRIQLVGQENFGGQSDNMWWEWVFGILALVAAVAVIIVFLD